MAGVLLFFAPTVVSAQVAPATTTPPVTSNTTQTTPTAPVWAQAAPSGTPIYVPVPTGQGWNPQFSYPAAPQSVQSAVPVMNPGGLTVQVTTQIGIPNQAMPGVMYPTAPGVMPTVMPPQGGYYPVYPGGVYNPTPLPATPSFPASNGTVEAIANPALLPLAAQTLWQQISTSNQTSSQTVEALQQLLRDYPNFMPAYVQLAQVLINNNRTLEAISILERGTTLYPNQPELARSLIIALGNTNRWTEAAMAARQFAIRNPNSPLVSEFSKLADESNKLAQSTTSGVVRPARNSMLGNLLTAGLGYLLLGRGTTANSSLLPNLSTAGVTSPLPTLGVSNQATQELLNRVQLLNDPEVSSYINDIGRKLAQAAGTNDFEFYVVRDRDSGAIALPNRKIFVSAGAIANTNSEAELASLIARQMGHAALSHPDQIARRTNLTSTLTRLLPTVGGLVSPRVRDFNNSAVGSLVSGLMGNVTNGLLKPNYTSQMVNQANTAATQMLNGAGYSQSSLVSFNGSDRHPQMKAKVQQLLGTASQPWWSLGR